MTASSPRSRRATIIDVARAASVSRQTVSNVVNTPERVAPHTLARVQAQIERLGYQPSRAAQTLKQERAGAWGIELNSAGFGRLGAILDTFLVELTAGAAAHGSHVVPFTAPDPLEPIPAYERFVASRVADGFVLTDTRNNDPRPAWLEAHHVPYAAFGRVWDDPSITSWVDVDGAAGIEAAVRHLADQGYERIGYLGWPEGSPVGDDRRSGWSRATADLGLAHPEWEARTPQVLDAASSAAAGLLDAVGPGGALVCASDTLALGAWRVLVARGLEPGRDVGLVGFDDTDIAQALDLSSLHQPLDRVADRVLHVLGARSASRDPAGGLLLPPELVVRSSSKPAGDRTTRKEK
ncbi:substrate-binding domain-containing protein [Terrabacter sp. NPDC080008]|uniref:LacI family DNA-binding transcriptional regulator n=1 Tax=Terrabacter sp. NPDC080008 TaxID=3155176 RepID=UPI00344E4619